MHLMQQAPNMNLDALFSIHPTVRKLLFWVVLALCIGPSNDGELDRRH